MCVREREREICAPEKVLLVNILSEEVSFKGSFEGREGRAVTESERKRIPDLCCREAKGTTTMPFSFEGGNAKRKVLSSEEERRNLEGT